MDIIKTLNGLIEDVNTGGIDTLAELQRELIHLRSELEQLNLYDVGSSLKILCKDLNLDPESVLLEYCNTENGFEVYYDEGIEETYLIKKGFIQL